MLLKNKIKILKKLYYKYICKRSCHSVKSCTHINGACKLTSNTILGFNVHFNGMKITGGGTVNIGDNFHSGAECLIITQFHNYDNGTKIPYDETYVVKNVHIGDNVWLGDRVTILGGVNIGEGAIVQAGSVVVNDIPEFGIAGGHPAKVFKMRNIAHYNRLKNEQSFH